MTDIDPVLPLPPVICTDGRQSPAAAAIQRGLCRYLRALGHGVVTELALITGRRADVVALAGSGEIWIAEIKSCLADFRADQKWHEYRAHCDRLYFAVDSAFPLDVLPRDAGLIVADRFGATLLREAPLHKLVAPRRRWVTLRFARAAALRLQSHLDPGCEPSG